MELFYLFSCASLFLGIHGLPIPTPTNGVNFIQSPHFQYATFVHHRPFVPLSTAQWNYAPFHSLPLLGYHQPYVFLVQPIQVSPPANTPAVIGGEKKPENVDTAAKPNLEETKADKPTTETPSQDYASDDIKAEPEVDPVVDTLMKTEDIENEGLDKDVEAVTRGELNTNDQDDDTVGVDAAEARLDEEQDD